MKLFNTKIIFELNYIGLKNTALTYLVFYVMEKYTELHFDTLRFNIYVYILVISIMLYFCAM